MGIDNTDTARLMTVGEFAKFSGISEDMLRHYDKLGIFKPLKRGKANNYRLYSPLQITVLKRVIVLRSMGMPEKLIAKMARERTPDMVFNAIRRQSQISTAQIERLVDGLCIYDAFHYNLDEARCVADETQIEAYEMPRQQIILGDVNDFTDAEDFIPAFVRFNNNDGRILAINQVNPVGGFYESVESFLAMPSQPTRFYSIDKRGHETKEARLYLVGYTRGNYCVLNDLPERMAAYAKRNRYVFDGPVYHNYLTDEVSEQDCENYLSQVCACVHKAHG